MSGETQKFIDDINTDKEKELISIGSSLKICLVAEGEADIYPRLGSTMEWDVASAHAVILETGKQALQFKINNPIIYNKEKLLNPWFVIS